MAELSLVLLAVALSVVTSIVLGSKNSFWWMTESGIAIIIGMLVGLMWYLSEKLRMNDAGADAAECARASRVGSRE